MTITESLKEAYKSRIEEEIEKITNPAPAPSFRPPSNNSSLLSYEAPEFVPSSFSASYWPQETTGHYNQNSASGNFNNFYDYTYTEDVTYYSGQSYYQGSERNENFGPQELSSEHLSQSEANIWGNMLDILKG